MFELMINIPLGIGALYLLYRVGTALADLASGVRHREQGRHGA